MSVFNTLWPRAEVKQLKEKNLELTREMRRLEDQAAYLTKMLDEATKSAEEARKETVDTMKRVINTQMLAAGSRGTMFDDVGPHPAPPKELDPKKLTEMNKSRAGQRARDLRTNFVSDFIRQQTEKIAQTEYDEEFYKQTTNDVEQKEATS